MNEFRSGGKKPISCTRSMTFHSACTCSDCQTRAQLPLFESASSSGKTSLKLHECKAKYWNDGWIKKLYFNNNLFLTKCLSKLRVSWVFIWSFSYNFLQVPFSTWCQIASFWARNPRHSPISSDMCPEQESIDTFPTTITEAPIFGRKDEVSKRTWAKKRGREALSYRDAAAER